MGRQGTSSALAGAKERPFQEASSERRAPPWIAAEMPRPASRLAFRSAPMSRAREACRAGEEEEGLEAEREALIEGGPGSAPPSRFQRPSKWSFNAEADARQEKSIAGRRKASPSASRPKEHPSLSRVLSSPPSMEAPRPPASFGPALPTGQDSARLASHSSRSGLAKAGLSAPSLPGTGLEKGSEERCTEASSLAASRRATRQPKASPQPRSGISPRMSL